MTCALPQGIDAGCSVMISSQSRESGTSEPGCEIHCCAWAAQLWPCHAQQGEGVQLTAGDAGLLGGEHWGCSSPACEFASPGVMHPCIIVPIKEKGLPFLFVCVFVF